MLIKQIWEIKYKALVDECFDSFKSQMRRSGDAMNSHLAGSNHLHPNHAKRRIRLKIPPKVLKLAAWLYVRENRDYSLESLHQQDATPKIPPKYIQQAIAQLQLRPAKKDNIKLPQVFIISAAAILSLGGLWQFTQPAPRTFKPPESPEKNLPGATLWNTNLKGKDLKNADLRGANLAYTDLKNADLSGANLKGANLTGANLTNVNLSKTNLTGAKLPSADLTGANLSDANLTSANLNYADLSAANMSNVQIKDAKLTGAKLP